MIREDNHTELKREVTGELKKEIVAFANSEGGNIYIGIEDDGTVVGIDDLDSVISKISNMIRDSIRPDITMFVEYVVNEVDKKVILKLEVSAGVKKPYYIYNKGLKSTGVFVRQGLLSVPASEDHIRKMIKESDGDSFEKIRTINQELTFEYLRNEFDKKDLPLEESQMVSLNLMTKGEKVFTNLGVLLSDQATHTIKIAVFQGKSKEIFRDRREFNGSLLKQLEDAYQYINMYNKTHSEISGLYRNDSLDYPLVSIRETLLNAIIHREYSLSGSTLVSIFEDRIEFVTLGGLVSGITLNDIMFGISQTRNEKLAAILYRLKLVEAYGTGIDKIMKSYANDRIMPKFEVSDNAFKVTLYNTNVAKSVEDENENEQIVIGLFKHKDLISRKDVESALKISQTMSGRILKQLIVKEKIVRIGVGINTRYKKK